MPKELELYYINFLAKSILPDNLGFALYYSYFDDRRYPIIEN